MGFTFPVFFYHGAFFFSLRLISALLPFFFSGPFTSWGLCRVAPRRNSTCGFGLRFFNPFLFSPPSVHLCGGPISIRGLFLTTFSPYAETGRRCGQTNVLTDLTLEILFSFFGKNIDLLFFHAWSAGQVFLPLFPFFRSAPLMVIRRLNFRDPLLFQF